MKYKINLLSIRKENTVDRVIYFALNYLRYILVVTQIVVIIVFFYRINIDQEIVDLQDAINQKREIILIAQPLIKEAKLSSTKLKEAERIIREQQHVLSAMDYLLSVFPEAFTLSKLKVEGQTISINGVSNDVAVIRSFYSRMQQEKKFKKTSLINLKKVETGIEFTFELSDFI